MPLTNIQRLALYFKNMKIKTKLPLAFAIIFLLVAIVAVVILINTAKITDSFRELSQRQSRLHDLADNIRYYDVTLTDAVRAFLIDPQDKAAYANYFRDADALDRTLKEAQSLATTSEDKLDFQNIDRVNVELVKIEESLLSEPDLPTAVALYRTSYGALKAEYSSYVIDFFNRQLGNLKAIQDQILSSLTQSIILIVVLVVSLLLVSVVISTALGRDFLSRLSALSKVAAQFAQGKFEARVPVAAQDELGSLGITMNNMLDTIQKRDTENMHLIVDLQAAKRLAEENSRLKSEFLSTMSHELRTPMNAIEGFTSIMLSKMGGAEFNEKTERYISRVNVNSKRLLQLINDFLDLSRVESGRLDLAHQPFSPTELALRWQTEIGVLAEKKNIGFELSLDPQMPQTVYGDEEAISKVALNLLGNAIKFTERGKVSLAVTNKGKNWQISVTDTGIGIPPHAREYVFEEFRQVDQTSKRKFGGTGLGLAIVQKYTRTMGGSVTLDSEVGKGSTFTVMLPLQSALEANGA